jgi:hypothetical protein
MSHDTGRQSPTLIPLLLLFAGIVLSFIASSGPIQWMDNGALLADAARGRFFSESLGPLDHPLYHSLGTVIQVLAGSRVLSLLNSMLLVPLAWLVVRVAASVGATPRQALLAAAATVWSHAVFWVSTKAEVYLLHAVLVLLAYGLYCVWGTRLSSTRLLLSIGLVTGLAASVDPLTIVVLLPLYAQLLIEHRGRIWKTLPGALLGLATAYPAVINDLLAGFTPLQIVQRYIAGNSTALTGTEWAGSLFRFDVLWHEKNALCVLLLSLIGPQLLGLLWPHGRLRRLLWSAAVLNLVFAVSYNVFDRFTVFVPGVALLSILGVLQLRRFLPRKRLGNSLLNMSVLSGPVAILLAYSLYASDVLHLPTHKESLPFREDIRYVVVPYLPDRSAQRFVHAYQWGVPQGSVIVADAAPMGALRAGQAIGLLHGNRLVACGDDTDLHAWLGNTSVYLARLSHCGMIADRFALEGLPVGYALHTK